MVRVARRVLVPLHRARGMLLWGEWVAGHAAERTSRALSIRRGRGPGAEARRSEVVGRELLQRRRWRPVRVGPGMRTLKGRRGGVMPRCHVVVCAIVLRYVTTG